MMKTITIGNRNFNIGETPYVMGILNATPDSFSDGGSYMSMDKALKRVKEMMDEGADIIDVGGESTRPGYIPVSTGEEIERTCFLIEAIKENFDIPVSLDTYKPEVAQAGILAGADMINDIWGLKYDDRMAGIIARAGVCCCLMHNRADRDYGDFVSNVTDDLKASVAIARSADIKNDKIILDAGIGFAKDVKQNLTIMNHMEKIVELGYPVLLGTSRKSFIGDTLNLPINEREEGTMATSVIGYMKGCSFFRVHDVRANVRALRMAQAVMDA